MSAPSLLLFDLGGVLIENSAFESLNRLLPAPLDAVTVKHRWLASAAMRRFELGEIAPAEFARIFVGEWGIRLAPDAFLREFASWPKGFYPGTREALRALRRKFRVGCLSNSNVVHWERFGGFAEDFDIAISSHRLRAVKPDDEAFIRAFEILDAEPYAICFFDDLSGNVETARRLGVRAFHVEGGAQLLDVLRTEGLLSD